MVKDWSVPDAVGKPKNEAAESHQKQAKSKTSLYCESQTKGTKSKLKKGKKAEWVKLRIPGEQLPMDVWGACVPMGEGSVEGLLCAWFQLFSPGIEQVALEYNCYIPTALPTLMKAYLKW